MNSEIIDYAQQKGWALYQATGWVGALGNVLGAFLFSLNASISPYGYWVWLISTAAMIFHLVMVRSKITLALHFVFVAINTFASYRYFGFEGLAWYFVFNVALLSLAPLFLRWRIVTDHKEGLGFLRSWSNWRSQCEFWNLTFSLSSAALLSMNIEQSPYAFYGWMVSNLFFLQYGLMVRSQGLVFNAFGYILLELFAIYQYFGFEALSVTTSIWAVAFVLTLPFLRKNMSDPRRPLTQQ